MDGGRIGLAIHGSSGASEPPATDRGAHPSYRVVNRDLCRRTRRVRI